ncbi:MAG: ATP-binding cassette domain-containing protein [Sporolactobacillus sp.]
MYDPEGEDISGGEAQKIAIARALYKQAPFVVLDEPTSALDPIAEYDIYSKFQMLTKGQTALYISHRLASCRFCDCILVFDSGRLVQRGTHEALLGEADGLYAALWEAQAQYYRRQSATDAAQ